MIKRFFVAALLASVGSISFAQDATPQEPEIGSPYLLERHGDWDIICIKAETPPERCEMRQMMLDQNDVPVAEVTIEAIKNGPGGLVAGATIIVPLETMVNVPLIMKVDQNNGKQYPYAFCNTTGCFARAGFNQGDIDLMKKGNFANLQFSHLATPDQPVILPSSLKGFTAAFNQIAGN